MTQLVAARPAVIERLAVGHQPEAPVERLPVPLAAVVISLLSMASWSVVVGVAALLL